ncbi:unnamed protein product [Mytilus coruscus]|uniref:HTH psq-type domain-containing protein n=1 Tax=Mytilus coruscus TaxID=42192 RepID=A0A6J8F4U3_MYTCO|nr:unnamed protein product [Mytilus coruscus]
MPKKRKQSVYRTYTDENFIKAIDGIKRGRVSQRKVASLYSIPQATLSDHMLGRVKDNTPVGRKPVIPIEIEKQIVNKCVQAAEMGLGMNKAQNNTPGKDWWYWFKGRNPTVTLRSPEKLTSIRARAFNSIKVGEYFLDLKKEMNRLGLNDKPELVWNMDEKGVPLEHTPSKVVSAKSSRTIPGRVSNTRERNTIVGCINARGDRMPPLIIVKGKTQKAVMSYSTADGPVGATWTYQAKAWTEDVLGIEWFTNIFLKKCGNQWPQLLILDGHHSHEVLGLIEKARENNITLLTLPPHTTHYICSLDRTVFGPLSPETESRVEEVTVVRTKPTAGPEKLDVSLLKSLTPSRSLKFKWSHMNRMSSMFQEVQKIHILQCFMHTLSPDVLLPIVDSETREAVESLISLDSSFSEVIYEVYSVIQPVAETLSTPCSSTTIDWNASVNAIFSVDPLPQKNVCDRTQNIDI